MQLSETIKLYMTKEQKALVAETMDEYIRTVNRLVSVAVNGTSISHYTTAHVHANLPSALVNQCIRDAKSIVNKYKKKCRKADIKNKKLKKQGSSITVKEPTVSVLKRPCCYINNQNFKIKEERIEFPVFVNGKSKRVSIRISLTDRQKELFRTGKLGIMRIVYKGRKIVAQIVYSVAEGEYLDTGNVMGVDLGIKCPAVSYISDGNVKFYGNGRRNKYIRRHYQYLRKKLQKAKHIHAVKRMSDKEQRIMKDIDHKISHTIIKTAVAHDVRVIKLERLANISATTRTSRKNNHSLHNWSFYRLAKYIEYKAKLVGIKVEYINAVYTSQKCPCCGDIHHAKDRNYVCNCGFHTHRDLLGAINICNSTEICGNSIFA